MRTDNAYISRKDYLPYPYSIPNVRLFFELDHDVTQVTAEIDVERKSCDVQPLVLNGQELTLLGISLDGQELDASQYTVDDETLTLEPAQSSFTLTITTRCRPAQNTALMGLYASGEQLFTQCEAEGFRRIMWFPDRPDVMTQYQVTLRAD